MQILNQALRHATDGFIGILDMFGFEDSKPSQLEQLCINLSSETMQHFYNTHIFKSSIESCREEGIASDVVIDYIDNVPCIDLIKVTFYSIIPGVDLVVGGAFACPTFPGIFSVVPLSFVLVWGARWRRRCGGL